MKIGLQHLKLNMESTSFRSSRSNSAGKSRLGPAVGLYGSPFGATNFEAGFDYKNYQQNIKDLPIFDDTGQNITT